MQPPPPGSLPFPFDERFHVDNSALQAARRFFLGEGLVGVETVAVAPNGTLALVDAGNKVRAFCCGC